jgi:hypothetical protein
MGRDDIQNKLKTIGIPEAQVKKLDTDLKARKAATDLATAAGVQPN